MNNKLKKVWLLSILCVTILSCLTFTSCSDDDKDEPIVPGTQASIIGIWRVEYPDGHWMLTFEKDGTFINQGYSEEDGFGKTTGTYTLNEDIIKIVYFDEEDKSYEYIEAKIITLTSDKLILLFDEADDYEVFTRVK